MGILPIAIAQALTCQSASLTEVNTHGLPLGLQSFLSRQDFYLINQPGLHPLVIYHRVAMLIGRPYSVTPQHQRKYHGKQAKNVVNELTEHCHN